MSPNRFAAAMQRKSDALRKGVLRAEAENLVNAKAVALKLSSGALTPQDMRRLGHPYAARGFSVRAGTSADPAVINDNGPFKGDWHTKAPAVTPAGVVSVLWNSDPNSRFFGGTVNMVPRPIRAEIIAAVRPARAARLRKAVADALRG